MSSATRPWGDRAIISRLPSRLLCTSQSLPNIMCSEDWEYNCRNSRPCILNMKLDDYPLTTSAFSKLNLPSRRKLWPSLLRLGYRVEQPLWLTGDQVSYEVVKDGPKLHPWRGLNHLRKRFKIAQSRAPMEYGIRTARGGKFSRLPWYSGSKRFVVLSPVVSVTRRMTLTTYWTTQSTSSEWDDENYPRLFNFQMS